MKKNRELLGGSLIFLAGILWGSIGMFVKELNRAGATGEVTNFLRQTSAFVLMIPICLIRGKVRSLRIKKRTLLACAVFGIVCHGLTNVCYTAAVNTIGMSASVVLLYLAPVFTMFFSMILFREKISPKKGAAIVLSIAGSVLAVTNGVFDFKSLAIGGILFGAGSGLCYGLAPIVWRFSDENDSPFAVNLYSFLFASVFLGLWMRPWEGNVVIDGRMIILGASFGLVATAAAYTVYYIGLQFISESGKVPVIASVEVVVATLLGVIVYNEGIGIVGICGIVLVLFAIVILNLKRKATS